MGNALRVLGRDIKAIFSSFFSSVIMVAVLVIPALYAWVNIYANWNPYANTGNVPIAIASSDAGYVTEDGEYVNRGAEIVEEIASSTSILWVRTETAEEAIAGVERGDYYGALVMQENLSRNMYDLRAALADDGPSITFYQNAKTNAIANKISTTAATTAEYNIQVKYLTVLIEEMLGETEEFVGELEPEEVLDRLITVLTSLKEHMDHYVVMIQKLRDNEGAALAGLDLAGRSVGGVDTSDARARAALVKSSIQEIQDNFLARLKEVDDHLEAVYFAVESGEWSEGTRQAAINELKEVRAELEALQDQLPDSLIGVAVSRGVTLLLQRAESLESVLELWTPGGDDDSLRQNVLTALADMRRILRDNLAYSVVQLLQSIEHDMDLMVNILDSVNATAADIQPVFSAAQGAVTTVNTSLGQFQTVLKSAADAIDKLLDAAINARDSDMLGDLIELLHGDPKQFAEFFAQPVSVTTETIYPVDNYGTAMTPFYSTLAIWVGCVVSGAIIKPVADGKGLRKVRPNQLFWGRFLIFFLVGQIQAAIIVAGDIWLLGCQCLYPGLFFLTAAVTSLVFNLLIYALTVTFGDIGKAIGVVIMIIQIAGSSGSYPIEILPEIFSQIYTFFPFPYAINAMRETLCGLFRYDLLKYLAQLSIFGVFGGLIGVFLRSHFHGVNEYIEEEMEETGVL